MKCWTKRSAEEFLVHIQSVLRTLHLEARIVGSVATHGNSENDLDLALAPIGKVSLESAISRLEEVLKPFISSERMVGPQESGHAENSWFVNIQIFDGRVVEFYMTEEDFPFDEDTSTMACR